MMPSKIADNLLDGELGAGIDHADLTHDHLRPSPLEHSGDRLASDPGMLDEEHLVIVRDGPCHGDAAPRWVDLGGPVPHITQRFSNTANCCNKMTGGSGTIMRLFSGPQSHPRNPRYHRVTTVRLHDQHSRPRNATAICRVDDGVWRAGKRQAGQRERVLLRRAGVR